MKKKAKLDYTNYVYLDQDPETGSQCEHVLVYIEESEPDPTKSVASCRQCPNGYDNETHYKRGKKIIRKVRAFRCASIYRKGLTKIQDPEVIDKNCPYRTKDASEMV